MSGVDVREAGDSALLLALDDVIDPAVNGRAIAIARAVRDAGLAGVRDVVPTFRSVAVHVDPLQADMQAIREALVRAAASQAPLTSGHTIDIPVFYGGEAGPDLEDVAAHARLSPDGVVARHQDADYRVFMLGFMPGFAYLGIVDERIAAPRHATPRTRVPGGSVGIAGRQTGVYPLDSPGGWQIIGRTPLRMFDPRRMPAALLEPGDQVRFHVASQRVGADAKDRAAGLSGSPGEPGGFVPRSHARSITVLHPGLLTTVQDSGRWGHQASGVSVSGAMDRVAHRVANALVGNAPDAASLEATIAGPELRIEQAAAIAITGADLDASLDGASVPPATRIACRGGAVLRFGRRRTSARAYIAVDGGIGVQPVLGSRATHAWSKLGGVAGRALRAGDSLPLDPPIAAPSSRGARREEPALVDGGAKLRFIPGPQQEFFPDDALEQLQKTRFTVAPQSDRVGYRLVSGRPIPRRDAGEMISDATFTGGIQVPLSGQPILLMADRQTTGGYPQIGVVITADLPAAAQLAPGDWIEFEMCTRADALKALIAQESRLLALA